MRKRKKERHLTRYEETIKAFKMANKATKLVLAKVKGAGYRDLINSWERKDRQQKSVRLAKQRNKEKPAMYQATIWDHVQSNEAIMYQA